MLLRNAAPIRIDIRKEDYARAETAATWAEDGCGCDEGRGKERGLCAVHRRSGNVWRVRIFFSFKFLCRVLLRRQHELHIWRLRFVNNGTDSGRRYDTCDTKHRRRGAFGCAFNRYEAQRGRTSGLYLKKNEGNFKLFLGGSRFYMLLLGNVCAGFSSMLLGCHVSKRRSGI